MGHGLKKAECVSDILQDAGFGLGFGFLFPGKCSFIVCRLFLFILVFYKGYGNSDSF